MDTAFRYAATLLNPAADPAGGADPWAGATEYTFVDQTGVAFSSGTVWIWCKDQNAKIRLSYDGINYGDDIYLWSGDQPIPMMFNAQRFQVQNAVAGSNAVVQVLAFA